MKNNWPVKKLEEVADILMGQSPSSSTYNFTGQGLPFFQGKAEFGDLHPKVNKYCSKPVKIAVDSDILLSVRAPVGPINIAQEKTCIGRGLSAIRAKNNMADQWYLYYLLKQHENNWLGSTGSTFQAINKTTIENLEIPTPDLDIQKKIVERLDVIRKTQELCDQQIQKIEELFEALLTDFLKNEWKKEGLGNLVEINPKKSEINTLSDNLEVTFLAMADVSENAEIVQQQTRKLKDVKKGFTYFRNGDVLVAKITPCFENGKGAIAQDLYNGIGFGSTEFHVLRASSDIINKFLFFILNDKQFRNIAKNSMIGSAGQQRIPKEYLENLKIKLPPIKEQQKIIEKLEAVQNYKKLLQKEKALLKELFGSVLDKSMKGELDN